MARRAGGRSEVVVGGAHSTGKDEVAGGRSDADQGRPVVVVVVVVIPIYW